MSDANAVELYRRYRPKKLADVVGQEQAVAILKDLVKTNKLPHVLLFSGPSGCGKTSLARILQGRLECADIDFAEINAANSKGIDMVRDITRRMGLAPMGGKCRIWLIDEAQKLTGDAQSALLKILEDTPSHVYFFICTTDPQKLLLTIRNRCTDIPVKAITDTALKGLVIAVADAEGEPIGADVVTKIVDCAEGSARSALVLLHKVLGLATKEEQMDAIEKNSEAAQSIDLCKALIGKANWKTVSGLLRSMKDEDPEGVRRHVLAYASSCLLNGMERAHWVMDCFRRDFFTTGKPGLVMACFEACNGPR